MIKVQTTQDNIFVDSPVSPPFGVQECFGKRIMFDLQSCDLYRKNKSHSTIYIIWGLISDRLSIRVNFPHMLFYTICVELCMWDTEQTSANTNMLVALWKYVYRAANLCFNRPYHIFINAFARVCFGPKKRRLIFSVIIQKGVFGANNTMFMTKMSISS